MDPKKVARIFVLGKFFLQKNGGLNLQSTEKKVMRISNHHHVIPFFCLANGRKRQRQSKTGTISGKGASSNHYVSSDMLVF